MKRIFHPSVCLSFGHSHIHCSCHARCASFYSSVVHPLRATRNSMRSKKIEWANINAASEFIIVIVTFSFYTLKFGANIVAFQNLTRNRFTCTIMCVWCVRAAAHFYFSLVFLKHKCKVKICAQWPACCRVNLALIALKLIIGLIPFSFTRLLGYGFFMLLWLWQAFFEFRSNTSVSIVDAFFFSLFFLFP